MKVTVIGTGYVGLVTGACLAEVGNNVLCFDVDEDKIRSLEAGVVPIHEPGLSALVDANRAAERLRFTTDARLATEHGDVLFIAVGTPPGEDGSADLQYVLNSAREIGRHMDRPKLVVSKSTVPVGTTYKVRDVIAAELALRGASISFHVASNPEFLKEGHAITDFMRPDRIVVGSDCDEVATTMRRLYAPFERNHEKLMFMDVRSAELTKYAANAMLATRISFMNEIALLTESLGGDIDSIRKGIGADPRIGHHFLYAGCGYGGSCFPKDVKALVRTGTEHGHSLGILQAVERANDAQKLVLVDKIIRRFGDSLTGRTFAIWGLAFKPDTDDVREAPSLTIIDALLRRGASIQAYDPVAAGEAARMLGDRAGLRYATRAMSALNGADALVVVTEWKEFRSPDLAEVKRLLRSPVVFDGRNILVPDLVREAGFEYWGIGKR